PAFNDCVRASVYGCGRAFKAVAADLDYSPSLLSRMLADNPDDPRNFPVDRLPDLIAVTADKRPVLWRVEKFLEDAEARRKQALDSLASMLPQINAALKQLEVGE
ncbi:MAG: hypothetical protein L0H83_10455, partial [Salinisphaera sp.]|nr:hypothetical protein [Salinisphaera sp.]